MAVTCSGCGLVYVSPRPTVDGIDEAARTGQHQTERGSIEVTGRYHRGRVKELRKVVSSAFADDLGKRRRLRWLDVGSGHGEMIGALRGVLPAGSTAIGMEPNEGKRRSATRRGFNLVSTLAEADGEFDVISLINVYSHLPDPVRFLSSLRERLWAGGSFLIATGNGADLERREHYPDALYLPDHLSFTGESQLQLLASKLEMNIVGIDRRRSDRLSDFAFQVAKMLTRRPYRLGMPYSSPFRTLVVRFVTTHV